MKEEEAYGPKELRETKLDNDEEKVEDKEGTCHDIGESFQYHSSSQHFEAIGESLAQSENRIKPRVCLRRITCSTMYEKAPYC